MRPEICLRPESVILVLPKRSSIKLLIPETGVRVASVTSGPFRRKLASFQGTPMAMGRASIPTLERAAIPEASEEAAWYSLGNWGSGGTGRMGRAGLTADGAGAATAAVSTTPSGHWAPSLIHSLSLARMGSAKGPPSGGINSSLSLARNTRWMISLLSGSPATTAGLSLLPPLKAVALESTRYLPFCFSVPWHLRQCSVRIGAISLEKSTAA